MKVLIGCEFSGIVREAFRKKGHDAWSCDLLPTEIPSRYHLQHDIRKLIYSYNSWDMMIVFPPCTHLAVSGARWFKGKLPQQKEALLFIDLLLNSSSIRKICLENPIGIISSRIRKPDQIIQPWQFGHPEKKATCLWLKNLPLLKPTKIIRKNLKQSLWRTPPSVDRWKIRSRTFQGIADAMADQWGSL